MRSDLVGRIRIRTVSQDLYDIEYTIRHGDNNIIDKGRYPSQESHSAIKFFINALIVELPIYLEGQTEDEEILGIFNRFKKSNY